MDSPVDEKPLNRASPPFTSPSDDRRNSFDAEKQDDLDYSLKSPDFDPFSIAKPCSPFYLYKHDSPRGSTEQFKTNRASLQVHVQDLQVGGLTPITTRQGSNGKDNGHWRLLSRRGKCMTKPKQRRSQWLASLPRWQRLLIKILIALVIIGAIVGIGVGISIKVHGGVYRSSNEQAPIGS